MAVATELVVTVGVAGGPGGRGQLAERPVLGAAAAGAVSLFRDRGVVLRTYRLGEADRIVVLLTEHHGKVRAVAKGVRRTGSKFGARLEPLSHVALLLWQGRGDLDVVNQAEVVDHFRTVREDLDRVGRGLSMLEVADQLAQERHPDPRLYEMLVGALRVLADPIAGPGPGGAGLLLEGARARRRRAGARRLRLAAASRRARWSWWPSTWPRAARCAAGAAGAGR